MAPPGQRRDASAPSGYRLEEAPWLARSVGTNGLRREPVHRWFVLGHSFSPALVRHLLERFDLRPRATVLDPFCGAGTTLVETSRASFRAVGLDLSPLAVLASHVKCAAHQPGELLDAARAVLEAEGDPAAPADPGAVEEAFDPAVAKAALSALGVAARGCFSPPTSAAIRLAVLCAAPHYALKVRKGGWLAWRKDPLPQDAPRLLKEHAASLLETMAGDAGGGLLDSGHGDGPVLVIRGDARDLPVPTGTIDALVTSPPYPNRHDYSRAYGLELSLGLCGPEELWAFRRQQLHSHPEARPKRRRDSASFEPPSAVLSVADAARRSPDPNTRRFVPEIALGWAFDMALVLEETERVLVPNGRAAFVVGNASYEGVEYPSDLVVAQLAEHAGLSIETILVARRRSVSAQQSARLGPGLRRESVVVLKKPGGS
jgi:tRNA G10  N-methylase Trm11